MTVVECKRCARCKEFKPLDEFGPGKRWKDGKFPYCRQCKSVSDKADRLKHIEKRRVTAAAYYVANAETIKARSRKQYEADPARWKANSIAWQKRNPDKRKAASAAWQQRNMQGSVREAVRRRAATRKGAKAVIFSKVQLEQRMSMWGCRCWLCGGPQDAVDHVKPLSKGGAHMLCNLRPICKPCNSSKSASWPVNTARRM